MDWSEWKFSGVMSPCAMAVEVEFDIAIAQGDITPENFHSLQSIEALVDRTLSLRS